MNIADTVSLHSTDAARRFERALFALSQAKDSRGLLIRLYRGTSYTAEGLREALRDMTTSAFTADTVKYVSLDGSTEDRDGEVTCARHLQLLTNAYVAALEFEREVHRLTG